MPYLDIAVAALDYTRAMLAKTLKSNNKDYSHSVSEWWSASPEKRGQWGRRNDNQGQVFKLMKGGAVVDIAGVTVLQAGRMLFDRAWQDHATWYGNCGEQAQVAMWVCHTQFRVAPANMWLVNFTKGDFGHSALLLADQGNAATAAYCDPWMNIACPVSQYAALADAKLREWTGKGKRLMYGTIGLGFTNRPVWVEPSSDKILGFAAAGPSAYFAATDIPQATR